MLSTGPDLRLLLRLLSCVTLVLLFQATDAKKDLKSACTTCQQITDNFNKGFDRTAKQNFGGGNTAWEERKLSKYETSEIRLVEIVEGLCDSSSFDCNRMVEEHEDHFETWWFKRKTKHPDLHKWFCVETIKVCCPKGTFGPDCNACVGGSERPCHGNGRCDGDGTRGGDGKVIDILWKQDIDLGARREVFDYNHRQKEHELQRQRELEEEKRLHLLREQEKALLAQLQLDEETGEYIPCPPPSAPLQSAVTPLEVTQNVSFTEENGDTMSFDECLQLLAETFPVEEAESTSVCLDTTAVSARSSSSSSTIMMSPEQPALPAVTLSPRPLPPPPPPPPSQRMSPDLEQAWMELLSLPELQQCLNMQMEDTLESTSYPLPNSPEVQNPNYTFYPMPTLSEGETNNLNVCPAEFMATFDGSVPSTAPPDNLGKVKAKDPNFSAEVFCDMFYPNTIPEENSGQHGLEGNKHTIMSDIPNKPLFTPVEFYSLSPEDAFDRDKQNLKAELRDSDSGFSTNTSPNASSPGKSVYGDGSFVYSDSDMEEMDHNPGSAESDYSEMFSLNFQPDNLQSEILVSALTGQPQQQQDKKPKQHKMEPAEENGHNNSPFTKDKHKKRSGMRLSRDEQRAKALKIPFTVDMIINLPVDDFNEMMSKHQLNEAQLALVRDIRRRGKNKVAAQNCRKRKMENIVGLEGDLDSLKDEKERLLSEKSQNMTNLKEMKKQLNSLYLEVFSMLRDEKGNSYSPSEYSLQQSTDGSVFLVPRVKKTFIKSEDNH